MEVDTRVSRTGCGKIKADWYSYFRRIVQTMPCVGLM